jgi:putative DNA primase/helicase
VDAARALAQDVMLELARQAMSSGNDPVAKFAGACLNSQRITAAMREAQPHLAITPDMLDADPWLLPFDNCTVDLRTGSPRPHRREDFITKLVRHRYTPEATCERFLTFLRRVVPRLESYVQKAVGYSLTGITFEKAVFICYGGGNNGKTTLLATIKSVLGDDYAVLLQIDTLMVRAESNNTQADLADLRGARFVMTSETEEGQRLAEGKLKRITQGMGRIKAARKYENPIEFNESHKLWLDCNHKPVIRGADNAIWNRLHLIPFAVTIQEDEIDRDLASKLLTEAEGILAWAVAGAVRWYQEGLGKPEIVQFAGRQWRSDSDQFGRFIEECCITGEFAQTKARTLYAAYRRWAEDSGEKHLVTETSFGNTLTERGFNKKHTNQGTIYEGIGLRFDGQEVTGDGS